jgi:hypothetical protein
MDLSVAVLSVGSLVVFYVLYVWHKANHPFDLRQLLLDSATDKISIEKVGYITALIVSSWSFVTMVSKNTLTEWFFTAYIAVFAAARLGSQGLSVYKSTKEEK